MTTDEATDERTRLKVHHPELDFLQTIAASIINEPEIKGIAFCLTREGKQPYVAFYHDAGPEMVLAMMDELHRVELARDQLREESDTPTVPVAEAVDITYCHMGQCVLQVGHAGYHQDVEGYVFDADGNYIGV